MSPSNRAASDRPTPDFSGSIVEKDLGGIEGQHLIEYVIRNQRGMVVKVINYGGTVTNIIVPDKDGTPGDVVLGFDSLADYREKEHPYFGSLIGRYAGRIAKARFFLEGKTYRLKANDGENCLHGGNKGFHKAFWKCIPLHNVNALMSTYDSPDGEEGFPGNLHVEVTYTLTPESELRIDYRATSDQTTPINLTSHGYFNLSAGKESDILTQELMLVASKYVELDSRQTPTGRISPVQGTPMDFRRPKPVGRDISKVKGGFDHYWILDKDPGKCALAATLYDRPTGRFMELSTTEPGVVFYSGNFLDGSLRGKGGKQYFKHSGLCLETQHFPDSPNQPSFPSAILTPGEVYRQTTVYKFLVK